MTPRSTTSDSTRWRTRRPSARSAWRRTGSGWPRSRRGSVLDPPSGGTPATPTSGALDWNAQRLAVLDHDIDVIIRTHAKDRKVAAWLEDTAEAFEEIGEIELAIDWAKQATDFDRGHQSLKAADYWCGLLEAHRPAEALDARLAVFRKWPSSTSAARLRKAGGKAWPDYRDEVVSTLAASPRDAVLFALLTLKDAEFACNLAHSLALDSDHIWSELVKAYEKVDPIAVLPIHQRLVENELAEAGAQHYRLAARRLAKMRELSAGSEKPRSTTSSRICARSIGVVRACSRSSTAPGSCAPPPKARSPGQQGGLGPAAPHSRRRRSGHRPVPRPRQPSPTRGQPGPPQREHGAGQSPCE